MLGSIEAFLIHLFNGLTFEFGDDLYCWAAEAMSGRDMSACRAATTAWVDPGLWQMVSLSEEGRSAQGRPHGGGF